MKTCFLLRIYPDVLVNISFFTNNLLTRERRVGKHLVCTNILPIRVGVWLFFTMSLLRRVGKNSVFTKELPRRLGKDLFLLRIS